MNSLAAKAPRAVIADDERLMRDQLRTKLNQVWPELEIVAEAKNGLEAVQAVKDHQPDVIFLDIRMPDMDGFSLLEELEKWPVNPFGNSRVFMLSSTLDERDLEKARSFKSVTDFIGKPLTIELCSKLLTNKN